MKRLIRKAIWPFVKKAFVKVTLEQESIVAYPITVWIEFEGREKYLDLGLEKFREAIIQKVDEIFDSLINAYKPDKSKPINQRYRSITQTISRLREMKASEAREQKENENDQIAKMERLMAELN